MESAARRNAALRNAGRGWAATSIALAVLGLVTVAILAVQIAVTLPSLQVNVEEASMDISPVTPVTVGISKLGVSIAEVSLTEQRRDIDGEAVSEMAVPVDFAPAYGNPLSYWSELRLTNTDGSNPLAYDRNYLLRLTVSVLEPAFPLPRRASMTREYQFRTLTSPQIHVPDNVVELGYKKPLRLEWNSPIRLFDVEIEPSLEFETWIDQDQPQISYVDLNKGEAGKQYFVHVVRAEGTNGAPMVVSPTITVETAAYPKPIADTVKVENGDEVVIQWDRPMRSIEYRIEPEIGSSIAIDPSNPKISRLKLIDPPQQTEYKISIIDGVGLSGAPLENGYEFNVKTPSPLYFAEVGPGEGEFGVGLWQPISIVFTQGIKDKKSAEEAVTITPKVLGRFEWLCSNVLQFVPEERYPAQTEIEVAVKPGRAGPRSAEGGYLEEPIVFSFTTRPDKIIDVDLSKQILTLIEAEEPVFTTSVATGVPGAETPPGEYKINFKVPTLRMRGTNPGGSRYDIPNVPWVMGFMGDYTIHGAPWRWQFGFPQSNGCVSMATSAAKVVYDWTPIGTLVRIHY